MAGTNANGPSPEFAATTGYNLCGGLGSPVGNLLIPGLIDYQPTVTSISPATGSTAGGTVVTIAGTDLTGGRSVLRLDAGNQRDCQRGGTQITATSPAGTGVVDVTVSGPGGVSTISAADKFTYLAPG